MLSDMRLQLTDLEARTDYGYVLDTLARQTGGVFETSLSSMPASSARSSPTASRPRPRRR